MNAISFPEAGNVNAAEVQGLLRTQHLPSEDVVPHLAHFFAAMSGTETIGVVGLELLGREALLRSLAVAEPFRGRGIAQALCAQAAEHARRNGAGTLYLLTTTAEGFFAKLGFRPVQRDALPETVRGTEEFRSLCPVTAVCMTRRV